MQPQNPPFQVPQFNWSYFKPEFSGKPEEDAIAHLLRTNDLMETHNFPQETKVQRFCLTLNGEARLWYESLRPIEIDWQPSKSISGNNTQNLVTPESNIFMCGDPFIMMKIQTL